MNRNLTFRGRSRILNDEWVYGIGVHDTDYPDICTIIQYNIAPDRNPSYEYITVHSNTVGMCSWLTEKMPRVEQPAVNRMPWMIYEGDIVEAVLVRDAPASTKFRIVLQDGRFEGIALAGGTIPVGLSDYLKDIIDASASTIVIGKVCDIPKVKGLKYPGGG